MVEEQPEHFLITEAVDLQEEHLALVLLFLHRAEEQAEEDKQTLLPEQLKVLLDPVELDLPLQEVQEEEVLRLLCLL